MEEITKSAKKCTRAKKELVSVLVHTHTPCSAHCSNGTLIDKRDGQKGIAGHNNYSHRLPSVDKSLRSNGERNVFGRRRRKLRAKLSRLP